MIVDTGPSIAGTSAPSARRCGVGGGAGIALVIPPHNVIVVGRNRLQRVAGGELVFCVPADAMRLGATRSLRDFSATRFKFFMWPVIREILRNLRHSVQFSWCDAERIWSIPAAHPKYTLAISVGMM